VAAHHGVMLATGFSPNPAMQSHEEAMSVFEKSHRFSTKPWVRRSIIGVLGLASLGAVASMSGCGTGMMHRDHGPVSEVDAAKWRDRMLDRAAKELALDDAQKSRLAKVADVMHAQRKAVMGDAPPREAVKTFVAGDHFDRQGAQSFVNARTDAMRNASPELIAAFGDFYDSLKPEQQQKVRDFLARGPRHHRMG
jgi:Spy/CpxP family protein refolding chaperone